MLSNSQDDNLKIVHEAENETEETITHNNNNEINPHQDDQNNDETYYNENRYPQARYSYIDQSDYPQNKNQKETLMTPVVKKYVNPEKNEQPFKHNQNHFDKEELNERDQNPRSVLMNGDDELKQELRKTQKSLQRLKLQQEYVTTSNFHSQKVTDSLPYQTYRDRFIQEKNDLRHNLHTPEELVVKTPNNYKRVKKNFYNTSKPFYNHDINEDRTIDQAILNNLEEKQMIDRIQRDINREKSDFLNSYQKNHFDDENNEDQNNISPQYSDSSINNNNTIKKVQNEKAKMGDSQGSNHSIDNEKKVVKQKEKQDMKKAIEKLKTDQLFNSQPQTLDHYPHSFSNNTPKINNPYDDVEQYNQLIYPDSYKETQQQMQESAIPRQITPSNYKEIYLEKQNKELFYPRNINQEIENKNRKNQLTEDDTTSHIGTQNNGMNIKDILLKSKLQQNNNGDQTNKSQHDLTYNFKTNETQMQMHYLNNKYQQQEQLDEKDLLDKLSSTYNVGQSIKDYKNQKEALKSKIKSRLTPSTDSENMSFRDKTDLDQETPRQASKYIQQTNSSFRATPNQLNQQNLNLGFDRKQGFPLTELDVDKTQLVNKKNSARNPQNSFLAEIPLSTRNSQRRDMNGNPILNYELPPRTSSTRNSQANQRYSSQPRSSKVYQQLDNFINPLNSFEKPNSNILDEPGMHLNTKVESLKGTAAKKLITQSVKKQPNNILSLDMNGIGNLDDSIQMSSAHIPKKNHDLRTQSVHITPRDSTKDKIFRQIDLNHGDYSQKKDSQKNFLEPQIDDFALIDRKYKINNNSHIGSLNNSRIDTALSTRNILQKPILYPSRRLPSLNKSKNQLYDSKCCHDKKQKNNDLYSSKKYTYGQSQNCSKSIKSPGQACLKCPVCTTHLKVERIGYN